MRLDAVSAHRAVLLLSNKGGRGSASLANLLAIKTRAKVKANLGVRHCAARYNSFWQNGPLHLRSRTRSRHAMDHFLTCSFLSRGNKANPKSSLAANQARRPVTERTLDDRLLVLKLVQSEHRVGGLGVDG